MTESLGCTCTRRDKGARDSGWLCFQLSEIALFDMETCIDAAITLHVALCLSAHLRGKRGAQQFDLICGAESAPTWLLNLRVRLFLSKSDVLI